MKNHIKYSKAISWFSDCRIPFVDGDTTNAGKRTCNIFETEYKSGGNGSPDYITDVRGRFPANILVSDDMLNDGVIGGGGSYSGIKKRKRINHFTERGEQYGNAESPDNYGDKGSNSRYYNIDKWFDNLIE